MSISRVILDLNVIRTGGLTSKAETVITIHHAIKCAVHYAPMDLTQGINHEQEEKNLLGHRIDFVDFFCILDEGLRRY